MVQRFYLLTRFLEAKISTFKKIKRKRVELNLNEVFTPRRRKENFSKIEPVIGRVDPPSPHS